MKSKSIILRLAIYALAMFAIPSANAADPIDQTFFGDKAIDGYDAVSYHTVKKPVKGSDAHVFKWKGANWHFSSASNLAAFKKAPDKYAPAYGGYCAWAAGTNKLASSDPKIFDLHEGKLYLNYSQKTRKLWLADKEGMIKRGNTNYPKLIKE